MEEKLNLNQLLQKPIAMMTGEELCFLITKSMENTEVATPQMASKTTMASTESHVCSDAVFPRQTALRKAAS